MAPLTPTQKRDFFDACENGRIGDIMDVLRRDPAAVNLQTPEGWSPLILAVQWAQEEAVACLLEHGADMELRDYSGSTARDLADQLNFETIGNQFRQAACCRETRAREVAQERAIGQYHSGLEAPVTLPRWQLRLKSP